MNTLIDPKVDCVFKALLGSAENANLLVDFLNAIVQPASPIVAVEILNPYNEKTFLTDKLTIVDVKARDTSGRRFQVEIQLIVRANLAARQLFTWAELYQSQLTEGRDFNTLQPVVSIWLLDGRQFKDTEPHHHFQVIDPATGRCLNDHFALHTLELKKWRHPTAALTPFDRWLYFFKEAGTWTTLPADLSTPEMEQAMATLKRFSEKERDLMLYRERLNNLREYRSRERDYREAAEKLREAEEKVREIERRAHDAEQRAREAEQELMATNARLEALLHRESVEPAETSAEE